jgi:hypothetical protein
MRRLAAAVLLLLLGLVAAGCASAASGTGGGGPATPSAPRSTAAPSPTGSSVTVDGVVEHGVEPGCLVLKAGSTSYLLLSTDGGIGATNVPVAVPVRVRGELVTGVASYCQQGTPLRVDSVTRR